MTIESKHVLGEAELSSGLNTVRVGRRIVVLPEVDSTNTYALEVLGRALDAAAADGSVIFAEFQSEGRGRLGRSWVAPRGAGLTFSVVLHEPTRELTASRYVMSAAVAVAQAIAAATDVEPLIRWPNDIYVKHRKLAGILVEGRSFGASSWLVAVGIGLNCLQQPAHFPDELRERVTSLEIESREPVDRTRVARAILRRLDELFGNGPRPTDEQLSTQWRALCADVGQHVRLLSEGVAYAGRVVDIEPRHGLLLQLDHGGRREFDPATTTRL